MSIIDKILGRTNEKENSEPNYSYIEENKEYDVYVVEFEDMSGDSWRSFSYVDKGDEPFVVEGNNIYLFERPEISIKNISYGECIYYVTSINHSNYREANFSVLNQEPSVKKVKTVEERARTVFDREGKVKYANNEVVDEEIHDKGYKMMENFSGLTNLLSS
jgi:hypothetical protein